MRRGQRPTALFAAFHILGGVSSAALKRMTVRALQTLALVAEGKPYGVIAEHLHVSYKTVANTCTQLKAKLGVRTLPELMRIAIQHLPAASWRGGQRSGPDGATASNSVR